MAIDLMAMPLSRYWSGNYITPLMRDCWERGIACRLELPEGVRELPKNTPYGGADAAKLHIELIPMARAYLEQLPAEISRQAWDEVSLEEPAFFQVDTPGFGALLGEAEARARHGAPSHLATAEVFFPAAFAAPFSIDGKTIGSLVAALAELEAGDWSAAASDCAATVRQAVAAAIELGFPLILDAAAQTVVLRSRQDNAGQPPLPFGACA